MSDFPQAVTLGRWEVLIPVRDLQTVSRWEGCRLLQGSTAAPTPTSPSKLLSCFWEQRPSERSAGHLPIPSPSYCFLLLGWQGNRTPANLISICFIWSLAHFICQLAYPNYYWAPGSGHSKLCQEESKCVHSPHWLQWSLWCCSLSLPHLFWASSGQRTFHGCFAEWLSESTC